MTRNSFIWYNHQKNIPHTFLGSINNDMEKIFTWAAPGVELEDAHAELFHNFWKLRLEPSVEGFWVFRLSSEFLKYLWWNLFFSI